MNKNNTNSRTFRIQLQLKGKTHSFKILLLECFGNINKNESLFNLKHVLSYLILYTLSYNEIKLRLK